MPTEGTGPDPHPEDVRETMAARLWERVRTLEAAIKEHHDQKADDRCIEDDTRLYAAAGLPPADHRVGDKAAMLANCARFIERRCLPGGWPTYAELESALSSLRKERDHWKHCHGVTADRLVEVEKERDEARADLAAMDEASKADARHAENLLSRLREAEERERRLVLILKRAHGCLDCNQGNCSEAGTGPGRCAPCFVAGDIEAALRSSPPAPSPGEAWDPRLSEAWPPAERKEEA